MVNASTVRSWPMDASATFGIAAMRGARLARFKSWPMLTASPRPVARLAVSTQAFNNSSGSSIARRGGIRASVYLDAISPCIEYGWDHVRIRINK